MSSNTPYDNARAAIAWAHDQMRGCDDYRTEPRWTNEFAFHLALHGYRLAVIPDHVKRLINMPGVFLAYGEGDNRVIRQPFVVPASLWISEELDPITNKHINWEK